MSIVGSVYTARWRTQPNPIGYYAQASTLNAALIGHSIILLDGYLWMIKYIARPVSLISCAHGHTLFYYQMGPLV